MAFLNIEKYQLDKISSIDEVREHLNINLVSGYRADFSEFSQDKEFTNLISKIANINGNIEDQCSAKHYYDLFKEAKTSQANRIIEIGVYMGGSATVLAGVSQSLNASIDLVDVCEHFLLFTYERIRRIYPELTHKIRLWYGDFASYVKEVLIPEQDINAFVHHDGSHEFYQVVKDLSALYFVKEKINKIVLQDTHLRGKMNAFPNFVDAAIFAVFGKEVSYTEIGSKCSADNIALTGPNNYEGNYFLPEKAEGMSIPIDETVKFLYPHPSFSIDDFIDKQLELKIAKHLNKKTWKNKLATFFSLKR